mgnify:CR=1 FL=1
MILETQTTSERQKPAPVRSSDLLAVSYGGGTNSTAMLCGFRERGIKPDLILFADTGAEMPHTYKTVEAMSAKVKEWWGMEMQIVRTLTRGEFEGLEGECLRLKHLPGLAYGNRNCSEKYKVAPQLKVMKRMMDDAKKSHVMKAVGIDAGEAHRIRKSKEEWATNWYPLVDWQWWREECEAAICKHGLPQPGKSACFFCPAMKKSEVYRLRDENPELLARALAIESVSQDTVTTKRGLGGQCNLWSDWLAMDDAQAKLMLDIEPHHTPCACIDG